MAIASLGISASVATAIALLAGAAPAIAGDETWNPNNDMLPAERAGHKSFVRDSAGRIVAIDKDTAAVRRADIDYGLSLKNRGWGAYDVAMQQCFGGGFKDDISRELNAAGTSFTFASASRWNQVAWSRDAGQLLPPNGNGNYTVDNWSRAWRENSHRLPASGMKEHYEASAAGRPAAPFIAGDPFAVGAGFGAGVENPEYASRNAAADARKMGEGAANGGSRYAILVAWDRTSARHDVNLSRMYHTLTAVYGIPASNIAVLHPNAAGNLPGYMNAGATPQVLPTFLGDSILGPNMVPVSGGNTRQAWLDALDGKLFPSANEPGGYHRPTANDSLLVYNTGHGGQTNSIAQGVVGDFDNDGQNDDVRYIIPDADNFFRDDMGLQGSHAPNNQRSRSAAGDPINEFQLSFRLANLGGIDLRVDGANLGALNALAAGSTDLDPLVSGALTQYAGAVLNTDRDPNFMDSTVIDFLNCTGAQLDPYLMTAALFDSGDQQFVGVVPTPGAAALLTIGGMLIFRRRRM